MTSTVVLVRHGSTSWTGQRYAGRHDPWLDAAGQAEVATLAADIARAMAGPLYLVTSPLRRARQTARAIVAATGSPPPTVDARWMEADFGIAEGLTFAALELRAPELAAQLVGGEVAIDWPGGETAGELTGRVAAALADARRLATTGVAVVVVAHAGPIRLATALAEGRDARTIPPLATGAWRMLRWEAPAGTSSTGVLPSHP